MELPPGIAFIVTNTHRIVLPPAIALCGIKLWATLYNVSMPIWLQLSLCVASFPLVLACSGAYADYRDRRQAALNGAILAPRAPTKWPGGLDLLLAMTRNLRSGYLGTYGLDQWLNNPFTITQGK